LPGFFAGAGPPAHVLGSPNLLLQLGQQRGQLHDAADQLPHLRQHSVRLGWAEDAYMAQR
jgi:hypothetical protein